MKSRAAPPADQPARDEITERLDRTLLVDAGAGTGKTTALVGRVASLLGSGAVTVSEIAAITFTEAAAAELRDRIRSRLEAAASDPELPAGARARIGEARSAIDTATITTLHGFARGILAEHPLEAGLPPGFRVLDEVEASLWFDGRWAAFAADLTTDPEWRPTLVRAHALGLHLDALRDVALVLWDQIDRLGPAPAAPAPTAAPPSEERDVSRVLHLVDEIAGMLPGCSEPGDRLLAHALTVSGALAPLRALAAAATATGGTGAAGAGADRERLDGAIDSIDALRACPLRSVGRLGRKGNWPDIASVRGHLTELAATVEGILDRQRRAILERLLARLHAFVTGLAAERVREGDLTFHDLLVVARDLLRGHPAVRSAVARRYRRVLIDEFQDTDPLQIELAVLITSDDPKVGEVPWHDAPPEAGRLFVAGDPAQSIYRFRRADLGLYHRVERFLDGAGCRLDVNFRSVPGVLEWVDHVFARLLDGAEPGVQAEHRPLRAHRPAATGDRPPVAVFGGPVDGAAGEVREREAHRVAAVVAEVVRGGWTITDPTTGEPRPARHHDVAVLLPDRNPLAALERALGAAGIPSRVESQSFVFDSVEVRELVAVVGAVDDPADEVALLAALRSASFGCGDDDLVAFRHAGGRWDYRAAAPPALPPSHPVVGAMAGLLELHEEARWQRVSDTVATVISRRRLFATALARRRPRDHWRRYRFILDAARAFDDADGGGHTEFLGWVRRRIDEGARALESPGAEPDDDAVRVLTVHGAKGLEFPVVILAGLGSRRRAVAGPVLWRPGGGYEVSLGSKSAGTRVATPGFDDLRDREDDLAEAERVRLLYVAATRARDHLIVSLDRRAGLRCHASVLDELHSPGGAPASRLGVSELPDPRPARSPGRERTDPAPPPDADLDRWTTDRRALLEWASRPATVAATTVAATAAAASRAGEWSARGGSSRGGGRHGEGPGLGVGRAVHAVLQHVDLPAAHDLPALAAQHAAAQGVTELTGRVESLAAGVVACPEVRELLDAGPWWREVPVAAPLGAVVVEGVVDLLVETPHGFVVVDYKTDHLPHDAALDAAVERYTLQGATYAYALERATGTPVARCAFVFARVPGPAVVRDVADLRSAIARLEPALAG